jgi:hypothetical protein
MQIELLPLWHQDAKKGENPWRSLIVYIIIIVLSTPIIFFINLFIILFINGFLALGRDFRQLLPIKRGALIPLAK